MKEKKILNNNKGQSLVEFVLLFALVFFISRFFLISASKGIEKEWRKAVRLITGPKPGNIEFR